MTMDQATSGSPLRILTDGGPLYHETDLSQWLVEPWNAISSLSFLVPAIYFLWILRKQYPQHRFLVYWCVPLLMLGGIGSALFHGFRWHLAFMLLDIIPIALLTLSLGYYFIMKLTGRWWLSLSIILASLLLRLPFHNVFEGHTAINIGYFITGLTIFIPALLYLKKGGWYGARELVYAILLLAIALYFRYSDTFQEQLFAMGTHWLWHLSTAAGCFFLGRYLVKGQVFDKEWTLSP